MLYAVAVVTLPVVTFCGSGHANALDVFLYEKPAPVVTAESAVVTAFTTPETLNFVPPYDLVGNVAL